MKLSRKLISAMLAVFMLLTCFSGIRSAAESEIVSLDELDLSKLNLPIISVNTANGAPVRSKTDYIECEVGITNTDAEFCLEPTVAGIRLRGNSTVDFPKKPYRIKFEKKQDLFGMGKAKSWVLLANYIDKTMVRTAIAFALGQELGLEFTSEFRFVNVVLNGDYIGVYLLCEQTQTGKNRVEIEEDVTGKVDTGYLLELVGNGDKNDDRWFVPGTVSGTEYNNWRSGNPMNVFIKTPEKEVCTDDQVTFISNYFYRFNSAILLQNWDVFDELCDVDSFVKFFLVNTFTNNGDGGYQLYFYKKEDGGKVYAGPLWDFDQSAAGSTQCGKKYKDTYSQWYVGSENPWFDSFSDWEPFLDRARAMYDAHISAFQDIVDYYSCDFYAENKYDLDANELRWGTVASTNLWRITDDLKKLRTYEENYEYLRRYYTDRTLWLDAHYHNLGEYVYNNDATCGADGTETAVCIDCGYRSTRTAVASHESIPHTLGEYVSDNNATCVSDCTESAICVVCGATVTRVIPDSVDPDAHDFGEYSYNYGSETCHSNGTETRICKLCNAADTREVPGTIDENAHKYGEYVYNDDANCKYDGTETAVCSVCGHVNTRTKAGTRDPEKHAFGEPVYNNDETCVSNGTQSFTCIYCGKTVNEIVEGTLDPDKHYFGSYTYNNDATSTSDGTESAKCIFCGHVDTRTVPGSMLGHVHSFGDYVYNNDATCISDGTETAVCTGCGKQDTRVAVGTLDPDKHDFGEYAFDNNATCVSDATKTAVCSRCGAKDSVAVPDTKDPAAHSFGSWTVNTAATCESKGEEIRICTLCKATESRETAALGHKFGAPEYVWSADNTTCTATVVCENDKSHTVTETAAAEYKVVKNATETQEGSAAYTAEFVNPAFTTQVKTVKLDKLAPDVPKIKFIDVVPGAFYEEAVNWAVANGVTSGTSETTFSPNNKCTRGQVVTFLWRAAGSPEPKTKINPFTDVKATGFYYKAVLWAVENDVTAGLSATTFGPGKECTRGQVVAFLWRAKGQPAPSSVKHPFTDVKSSGFYFKAMLWAVENGITNGTTATTFGPNKTCTRGQVVTFLYRSFSK